MIETDVVVLGLGAGAARGAAGRGRPGRGRRRAQPGRRGVPVLGCTPSKLLIHAAQAGQGWPGRAADPRGQPRLERPHPRRALEAVGVRLSCVATDAWTAPAGSGDHRHGARWRSRRGSGWCWTPAPSRRSRRRRAGRHAVLDQPRRAADRRPGVAAGAGGGPIGCEARQAARAPRQPGDRRRVADRLLGPEEPEAYEVSRTFQGHWASTCTSRRPGDLGAARRRLPAGPGRATLAADRLLVATGRRPNLRDVGLETVGWTPAATPSSPTSGCGPASGSGRWGHHRARRLHAPRALPGPGRGARPASATGPGRPPGGQPGDVHRPEIGAVGPTEAQARARRSAGRDRACGHPALQPRVDRRGGGVVKLVADAERGVLVGATSWRPYGGEVVGLLTLAVHAGCRSETLRGCTTPTDLPPGDRGRARRL